jgi:hypothetical protein
MLKGAAMRFRKGYRMQAPALARPGEGWQAPRRPRRTIPALAALLLAVAVFFITWRVFRLASVNMTLADMIFLATALLLLVKGRLRLDVFGQVTVFYLAGLVLMLGGLLVATIAYGDPMRWSIASSQYLFAWLVVPMVFASFDRQWLRRCMVLFVVGVAVSQLIGGLASLYPPAQAMLGGLSQGFLTGNGRVGAMTGEPNPNGAVCTVAFIFLLNSLQQRMMSWKLALPCALLLAWGIVLSASFTAAAAVTVCTLFMLAASGFSVLAKIGIPAMLAISAYFVAGGPLPQAFEERVASAILDADPTEAGTFVGRSLLIQEAWDLADDNLLVGMGVDRYRVNSEYGAPVHHFHLLILNEGGAVAYLGVVLMLGLLLAVALNIYGRNRHDGAMCLSLLAVFMVYTMAVAHMYDRIWMAPVILALCASMPLRRSELTAQMPPGAPHAGAGQRAMAPS